jgi:hypothetical protein
MNDRLAGIEERWALATPGPWDAPFESYVLSRSEPTKVCQLDDPWITNRNRWADSRAIAAAPTDVAWLVAEVKRLRGALSVGVAP